ncbi:hypothetical protein CIL05_21655, partial [Virgibacillus profundi]
VVIPGILAVIPAPIAYIKVVVVKKLVVGSQRPWSGYLLDRLLCRPCFCWRFRGALNRVSLDASRFTLKKLECSKQAVTPEYSCME